MRFSEEELNAAVRLRNLEERKSKIAQQKAELERKEALLQAAIKGKNHKQDAARKILLGAFILSQIKDDPPMRLKTLKGLDKFLVKARDRSLFPELEAENMEFEEATLFFK
jgi:hypothetical protein